MASDSGSSDGGSADAAEVILNARPKRRELLILALILALGAGLRVAYLFELQQAPDLEHPPVDGGFSLYWARALATGDWSLPPDSGGRDPRIREYSYIRPPGYAYVLAGLYGLTDGHQLAIRGVQLFAGLLSIGLCWWLGRLLLGPSVGLLWAGLLVLSWQPIYFEGGINENWLLVLLIVPWLLLMRRLLQRPSLPIAAVAGVLLGLVALFRPNILLFAPIAALWLAWALRRSERWQTRRFAMLIAGAGLGMMAIIALPMTRNYRVEGAVTPVSANGGLVFYHSNNRTANAHSNSTLGEFGSLGSPWELPEVVARVEARSGRSMTFADASRFLGGEGARWVLEQPTQALSLLGQRAVLFWGPDDITHSRILTVDREHSTVLKLLPIGFATAAGGGLTGLGLLVIGYRRRREMLEGLSWSDESAPMLVLIGLFVAVWFVSFIPFFVTSLFRAPVVPFLLLAFSALLVTLADWLRTRSKLGLMWAAALAAGLAVAHISWIPQEEQVGRWHYARATAYALSGDIENAALSFKAALAEQPTLGDAHNGLGKLALDAGDVRSAEQYFRKAVRYSGFRALAHANLGGSLAAQNRWPEARRAFVAAAERAPHDSMGQFNLGVCEERLGRLGQAREFYEQALVFDSNNRSAANNLAWLLATAHDDSVRDGSKAVALAEKWAKGSTDPGLLDTLAAAYAAAGRFDDAIVSAEKALTAAGGGFPAFEKEAAARLALYRDNKAYRVPASPSAEGT